MRHFILVLILFNLILVSAETPYTPEVITARGKTIFPVNFFNSEEGQTYFAKLEKNSPSVRLDYESTFVEKESFGSFNLIIGENEIEKRVYFDNLVISNQKGIYREIPIIIGLESKTSEIEYDVSIDFDALSDMSVISGETIISPNINVYKLNYNNAFSNSVALKFSIYSIYGEILSDGEEVVSVSRQSSFEQFFNLGINPPNEILIVVSVTQGKSVGLDLLQTPVSSSLSLSPPNERDYPTLLYLAVFIFLLSSIFLISYLWYNHSLKQAKGWKSEIDKIRKTKFSSYAKALRRLAAQKSVLQRAYLSHYITKDSFDMANLEIDKLVVKLKKRL